MKKLLELNSEIRKCKKCPQLKTLNVNHYDSRLHSLGPFFGYGSPHAKYYFVGVAPSCSRWVLGKNVKAIKATLEPRDFKDYEPLDDQDVDVYTFYGGQTGNLFFQALSKSGINISTDVYICNLLRCSTPNNREPLLDEIKACMWVIDRELQIMRPEVVVPLGRVPCKTFIAISAL